MNTLKLIHAADLHLDSEFEALSPESAQKRRQGQRKILFRLADECLSRGAQALLLSGDVFESDKVSAETQLDFCRALGALSIPVLISPGNHDPYFPGCVWERMKLPENIHIFKNGQLDCIEHTEMNARFWGAGFNKIFSPALLSGFSSPKRTDGVFDIMILHGDLGVSDYSPVTRAEIEKSGMDYVALGHIHTRSELEYAGKTAFAYPGCPEGRGFDETGEKGCYFVTLSDSGVSAQFVPLGGARYEILHIDITETPPLDAVSRAVSELSVNDYCRIILTGEVSEPLDLSALRRDLDGRFAELQIRDETTIRRDVWEDAGKDSLAGLFLQKLFVIMAAATDEDEMKKIELAAAYGLTALEGEAIKQ